jgi:hypothetical protein
MRDLRRYFTDRDGWTRLFIPARLPVFRLFLKLVGRFPGYGRVWRLADFNLIGRFLSILLASGFCATLLFMRKDLRLRWLMIPAFVPWFFTLLSGDVYDLIAYYLLFSGWFLLYEEGFERLGHYVLYGWSTPNGRDTPFKVIYLVSAFLSVVLLRIASGRFGVEFLRTFIPVFAGFWLFVPCVLWLRYQKSLSGHLPFVPVFMVERGRRKGLREVCVLILVLHIVATPVLLRVGYSTSDIVTPVPQKVSGLRSFSWETLEALWNEGRRDASPSGHLPDLSDYVAHMVYQEGMTFGLPYGFPAENRNREVKVSEYRPVRDGKSIVKKQRIIKSFDDPWLKDLLTPLRREGVERMLIRQGRPVRVVYLSVGSFFGGFSFWKYGVLVLFVYFVLFSFDFIGGPVLSCANHNQTKIVRRRAA